VCFPHPILQTIDASPPPSPRTHAHTHTHTHSLFERLFSPRHFRPGQDRGIWNTSKGPECNRVLWRLLHSDVLVGCVIRRCRSQSLRPPPPPPPAHTHTPLSLSDHNNRTCAPHKHTHTHTCTCDTQAPSTSRSWWHQPTLLRRTALLGSEPPVATTAPANASMLCLLRVLSRALLTSPYPPAPLSPCHPSTTPQH
jgi:hypothetical protein